MGDYLFGLDTQLLADTILLAIAIFILFILLSYLLFNPARDLLEKRRQKIREDIDSAQKDKADANLLREEYECRIKEIRKEEEAILSEARKKAKQNGERIVEEAREEANRMIIRASQEAELEKRRVADDMKKEMIQIASLMAGKVVSASIDTTIHEVLIDETLKEMGDSTWQS